MRRFLSILHDDSRAFRASEIDTKLYAGAFFIKNNDSYRILVFTMRTPSLSLTVFYCREELKKKK